MKKILIPFISLFLFHAVTAQQITDSNATKKIATEDYDQMIKQANSKKTAGILMIVAGSGIAVGGIFVAASGMESQENSDGSITTDVTDDSKVTTGTIMMLGGLGIGLGSIPFFIQSHKLREKATLGLNATTIKVPGQNGSMVGLPQTQVTLRIPLGR